MSEMVVGELNADGVGGEILSKGEGFGGGCGKGAEFGGNSRAVREGISAVPGEFEEECAGFIAIGDAEVVAPIDEAINGGGTGKSEGEDGKGAFAFRGEVITAAVGIVGRPCSSGGGVVVSDGFVVQVIDRSAEAGAVDEVDGWIKLRDSVCGDLGRGDDLVGVGRGCDRGERREQEAESHW